MRDFLDKSCGDKKKIRSLRHQANIFLNERACYVMKNSRRNQGEIHALSRDINFLSFRARQRSERDKNTKPANLSCKVIF